MRKLATLLLLLSLASVVNAQPYTENFIGMSTDEELSICYGVWEVGASTDVH